MLLVAPRRRHDVRLLAGCTLIDVSYFFEMSFLGYNYAQHQNAQQSVRIIGCRIATIILTFLHYLVNKELLITLNRSLIERIEGQV